MLDKDMCMIYAIWVQLTGYFKYMAFLVLLFQLVSVQYDAAQFCYNTIFFHNQVV